MSNFGHRGLTSDAFAAELARGADFQEVLVYYEAPAGVARCQRIRAPLGVQSYNVSFNGSVLASARSSLTLADLNTLVGFTAEPPTVAEQIADLETRVAALEGA